MIINLEQRHGKLIASYINKEGDISYSQFNVPIQQQYMWGYSRQKNKSDRDFMSWDKQPVAKIPCQFLNKQRAQEFFMDAGENMVSQLFEQNTPKLYSCDIEVDVTDDGFAEASDATNRINTIAWTHYPDIYVFGLKELNGEQCTDIERRINEHVKKFNRKYNFIYKYHANEADMLYDFLYNYARHAPLITGWFFWAYDWQYIINRCKRLNLDISWMSPTRQWYQHRILDRNKKIQISLPQHKLIVDYMTIYKKWDRSVEIKENSTLDFVADTALGIKKVNYSGTLQDLYNKDYDKYVFYNAIDSVLVELLDGKLKTMSTFLSLGNITKVESMDAFSPIQMLLATMTRYAYKKNIVFPKTNDHKEREEYEGAFVHEPIPGLYNWVASFDFKGLYPSIMLQFKISIENFLFKDKNHIPNDKQIKCVSGAVFDINEEPLIPEIIKDFFDKRIETKKISVTAEKESYRLKKILEERKSKINI